MALTRAEFETCLILPDSSVHIACLIRAVNEGKIYYRSPIVTPVKKFGMFVRNNYRSNCARFVLGVNWLRMEGNRNFDQKPNVI